MCIFCKINVYIEIDDDDVDDDDDDDEEEEEEEEEENEYQTLIPFNKENKDMLKNTNK